MRAASSSFIVQTTEGTTFAPRQKGLHGTLQTLHAMRDITLKSSGNYQDNNLFAPAYTPDLALRDFALQIVADAPGHDDRILVDAIFFYVRDRIRYRKDPWGYEKIQDARRTITTGIGDCGDKAVLFATLAALLGYKSRFVVLSFKPPTFQHVYLEVLYRGRGETEATWHVYDPTPEESIPGWEAKGYFRAHFSIFDTPDDNDPNELAGIGSFFKKLGKGLLKVAPFAAMAIPFIGPAIGGPLAALGAGGAAATAGASAGLAAGTSLTTGLINFGLQAGSQLAQQASASSAGKAAEKDINKQFDAAVPEVNKAFAAAFANPNAQTAATAQNALATLVNFVQASPTNYTVAKLQDPNYFPAWESQLAQIKAAAGPATGGGLDVAAPGGITSGTIGGIPTTYLIAGGAAGLVLLIVLTR